MCTFNVSCVGTFQNFLHKVIEWSKGTRKESIAFDTLFERTHWMINITKEQFRKYMDEHLEFMLDNTEWFESVEIAKMERVRDYMYPIPCLLKKKIKQGRRDFYSFFKENDVRLGTDLLKTFPMYKEFYEYCKGIYEPMINDPKQT